ncbi:nudix hydrolase 15, mitochondrial-like [Salvia miltiorrhiza]|uniref:nudix hydrolase 15, mitochondrial-like n=1 Tax=Salvia miltiorrhiza TaxID=226208 RepID=UPI0025AC5011|nr:nudix hydrolase 15, mitochondrial-like [Salvia miltiorrhiza]
MCSDTCGKSDTLLKIADRLRLYQPDHAFDNTIDTKYSRIPPSAGELDAHGGVRRSRAAVLICLFQGKDGDLRVILTKRSSAMSSHSGEVALPGGKWEEGDESDAATALREAKEEIGLDPSIVEVVAILDPIFTKREMDVFPVIGIVWDMSGFKPILNPSEVESVFDAPLEMFLKNEKRREEMVEWMGHRYLLHFFDYETENRCYTIWAFTASILIKVASIVYERAPAFEELAPRFWSRSRH